VDVDFPVLLETDFSGGRSQMDPVTQVRSLGGSQLSSDRGVSALLSNWKNQIPLVLIIGNKCRVAPVPSSTLSLSLAPTGKASFSFHFYEQLSFNCQEGVNDRVIFRKGTVLWIGFAFLMLGFVEVAMKDDGSVSLTRLLVS